MIHTYWLEQYGIEGRYIKLPVEPETLAPFITRLRQNGYAGCNVTIPHKEAAFELVRVEHEQTRRIGAINTIFERDGRLVGENTDGEGFLANLMSVAPDTQIVNQRIAILGAGGAAISIAAALIADGACEIAMINRSIERADSVRKRLGPQIKPIPWDKGEQSLAECALLVNTTSLGMIGQPPLDLDLSVLPMCATVTDIVYVPLVTPLLRTAQNRGHPIVTGLGMLLHQAVPGFQRWFGIRPAVTPELYNLVARDIDPDFRA